VSLFDFLFHTASRPVRVRIWPVKTLRFCIRYGVDKGLLSPGSIVKQGNSIRFVCWRCKDLKGGRFCCICQTCTDCNRRHGYGIKSLGPCG
jgi:hypothetical protein